MDSEEICKYLPDMFYHMFIGNFF